MIGTADGAGLFPGLRAQLVALVLARDGIPRRVLEQRIVGGRIVGAILPAHAERQRRLALIGQLAEPALELHASEIGPDRRVAASDVEADTDHRHLVAGPGAA